MQPFIQNVGEARLLPTLSLLEVFYPKRAALVLEGYGGSVRRLLQFPPGRFRLARHRLLAAQELVRRALLEQVSEGQILSSPERMREFLRMQFDGYEAEHFLALWLNAQNRLIVVEELFRGTLSQTSVYPREVVKAALRHNAAAVALAHNHPSGVAEPSRADELLTRTLRDALALIDVKVIDHLIVAGNQVTSFAERGLL